MVSPSSRRATRTTLPAAADKGKEEKDTVDVQALKTELLQYLEKRKQVGADELAKQ
jgi:hypothetical protein